METTIDYYFGYTLSCRRINETFEVTAEPNKIGGESKIFNDPTSPDAAKAKAKVFIDGMIRSHRMRPAP